jgi:methylenetetrahydrofolate reductase (NADPH)
MKIIDLMKNKTLSMSFEVFPPKTETAFDSVKAATEEIAKLRPSFMSVTYGAGGSTRENTVKFADAIQSKYDVTTIAHLTCVGATKADIRKTVEEMKVAGIENILALRGDRPAEFEGNPFTDFHYASELIAELKTMGDFCIGGACYPEGHTEAANKKEDILNLKKKVDAGCEFLTTQMFFDNNILYNFLYRIREQGITVPVIAGIMPITRATQVKTAVELSGTNVPERFRNLVDHFGTNPAAMEQAGIAYATDQIIDLIANGINNIHVYSMNKPHIAEGIKKNISEMIG